MTIEQRDFIIDCMAPIFIYDSDREEEFYYRQETMLEYDFPTEVKDIQMIIKYCFGDDFFTDKRTGNKNRSSTVATKIAHNFAFEEKEDEEYINMQPKKYIASLHFAKLQNDKLAAQPLCECCGNKATKIFLKTWNKKGREELDDVWALCPSCRIVDGQPVAKRDLKQLIKDEINNDEGLKAYIRECAEEIIRSEAIRLVKEK